MKLVIIGAGGHAKVVVETAQLAGWQVLGFADENLDAGLFDLQHLGKPNNLELSQDVRAIIAIGSNSIRQKLDFALSPLLSWATIIHPKAIISSHAKLQLGTVVFAGAVIQAATVIGKHCIVNSSASIDHDCNVADYCHVAPSATLTGGVTLETGVFVGAGAIVAPNKIIGAWSTLGAGGVAVKNLQPNAVFTGVPAKKLISS